MSKQNLKSVVLSLGVILGVVTNGVLFIPSALAGDSKTQLSKKAGQESLAEISSMRGVTCDLKEKVLPTDHGGQQAGTSGKLDSAAGY